MCEPCVEDKPRHQKPKPTRDVLQKIVMLGSLTSQQWEDRRWMPSEDSMWSANQVSSHDRAALIQTSQCGHDLPPILE